LIFRYITKIKYYIFVIVKILRYILFPIVPIYFLVTWIRNKFYDYGIFKSTEFKVATICVGNLSVGGTGKTPMIEYLIRLLKDDFQLATLSRGYKRSTKGFMLADEFSNASTLGDEPFQFYNKFKEIVVSVDEDRRNGISKLLQLDEQPDVILLDDAYQHRKVKATFNILLTAHHNLYSEDIVLPTGDLREPRNGAKRADFIVVTKCPDSLSEGDKLKIIKSLKPRNYQEVFFSSIAYSDKIKNNSEEKSLAFLAQKDFTLVTGIANAQPLVDFLKAKNLSFEHLNYDDHHNFTSKEMEGLKSKKFILTTEKDFVRLSPNFEDKDQLFFLPIELTIDRPEVFAKIIKSKI